MTDMPQMVAIYNGMGGGAAAAIAAIAFARGEAHGTVATTLASHPPADGVAWLLGEALAILAVQGTPVVRNWHVAHAQDKRLPPAARPRRRRSCSSLVTTES